MSNNGWFYKLLWIFTKGRFAMTQNKRLLVSAIIVAVLFIVQSSTLDKVALTQTEQGLSRALLTYGVARSLNGIISVVQGTEVAVEPVGIGMTFTPGQILDPVNDLIERFSTVVLVSATAFGLQRVLLEITAAPMFVTIVCIAILISLLLLWLGAKSAFNNLLFKNLLFNNLLKYRHLVYKLTLMLVIIRISIAATALAGEVFYNNFLATEFQSSKAELLSASETLEVLQNDSDKELSAPNERSFFESARDLVRSATGSLDINKRIEEFKVAAENISEHVVRLIVIFVFQTIVVPILSLFLILKSLKWLALYSPENMPNNA